MSGRCSSWERLRRAFHTRHDDGAGGLSDHYYVQQEVEELKPQPLLPPSTERAYHLYVSPNNRGAAELIRRLARANVWWMSKGGGAGADGAQLAAVAKDATAPHHTPLA